MSRDGEGTNLGGGILLRPFIICLYYRKKNVMFIPYNEQKHLRWGWKDHDNQPEN